MTALRKLASNCMLGRRPLLDAGLGGSNPRVYVTQRVRSGPRILAESIGSSSPTKDVAISAGNASYSAAHAGVLAHISLILPAPSNSTAR